MDPLVNNMVDNVVELTLENFQQVVLQQSKERLVVVDFWAEWCEPCKNITPILRKLAAENPDTVLLATVDCEKQQEIAGQFGVKSLPTVILVKDGQPVDGFAGEQTEAPIREMFAKHLPSPEADLLEQGAALIAQGDYTAAFTPVKQAYELNPDNIDAKLMMIDCYIEQGYIPQAKELLATIGLIDQDGRYVSLQGKIELAEQAAESPEIKALQEKLAASPEDMELKVQLSVQLHQANQHDEALALLYSVLKKDLNFGDAKKLFLDMVNALPDGDSLKSEYRRKMYSLLY
ncbi:thioredoxin [Alteromonas oceanisediminis]|uniref:thioredoxin n=1 Tax=Alteromonas oceanisediminis TaxID=2836180 RepID=UPI001BDB6CC2|nr:thioredoxin [Alteromonas oceanisediminis]MBT0586001.1 thioredoxin [Alteromonas oceanisediminis]